METLSLAVPARPSRNVLLNILGQGAPLIAGYAAIPALARSLGSDRFGILALAWAAVGYLSIFDLGLGRALTQVIASRLRCDPEAEIANIARTSLLGMTWIGSVAVVIGAATTTVLVDRVLHVDPRLRSEAVASFFLLSLSIPVVTLTAALRGLLEAKQRFDLVNVIRVPMGLLSFLGPLAALPFSRRLDVAVAVLVVGRVVFCGVHVIAVRTVFPALRFWGRIDWPRLLMLMRFGSWMTVSNLVSPLMVILDRFLIAVVMSTSAVAFYAAPYEALTKLWILPGAVASVLFALVAANQTVSGGPATSTLFARANKGLFCMLFPLVILIVGLARPGLDAWLGPDYAARSANVARWLAIGVLINSHAQLAFALIQGMGRPDLTAKLHLMELPVYLIGAWFLIGRLGIEGAAIAWTLRCTLDALGLCWMAHVFSPGSTREYRRAAMTVVASAAVLGLVAIDEPVPLALLITVSLAAGAVVSLWFGLVNSDERAEVRHRIRALVPAVSAKG